MLGVLIVSAVTHRAIALPVCQEAPPSPGVVADPSDSGARFTATGEATIMSETAEGLALAEDAARLDGEAALQADRRVQKTADGQLHGIRVLRACRNQDKLYLMMTWDLETARRAAEASAAMSHNTGSTIGTQVRPKPDVDRSVFDRLMH